MGENIVKGQVEAFKKSVDKAMEDLLTPDLFSNPVLYETEYTAEPMGADGVREGEQLFGFASKDRSEVILTIENRIVGRISGDGAAEFASAIERFGMCDMLPMKVTSVSDISGFFTVRRIGF